MAVHLHRQLTYLPSPEVFHGLSLSRLPFPFHAIGRVLAIIASHAMCEACEAYVYRTRRGTVECGQLPPTESIAAESLCTRYGGGGGRSQRQDGVADDR